MVEAWWESSTPLVISVMLYWVVRQELMSTNLLTKALASQPIQYTILIEQGVWRPPYKPLLLWSTFISCLLQIVAKGSLVRNLVDYLGKGLSHHKGSSSFSLNWKNDSPFYGKGASSYLSTGYRAGCYLQQSDQSNQPSPEGKEGKMKECNRNYWKQSRPAVHFQLNKTKY